MLDEITNNLGLKSERKKEREKTWWNHKHAEASKQYRRNPIVTLSLKVWGGAVKVGVTPGHRIKTGDRFTSYVTFFKGIYVVGAGRFEVDQYQVID